MTDQEARDEREALIADAKDFVDSWDHRGSWTPDSPVGMIARLAAALESEMERKQVVVDDAMADRAQIEMHEFFFGQDVPPLTRRQLGIARQAWKAALDAALSPKADS